MKTLLCACAALIMALPTMTARAAPDVSGTWTGEFSGPDGGSGFQITFTFKQDGDKLTGTVLGPQGDPIAISDGTVNGDKISFKVSFNGMTITHEGTINGDENQADLQIGPGGLPRRRDDPQAGQSNTASRQLERNQSRAPLRQILRVAFSSPGSPATGLRRWGGSKSRLESS